MGLFDGLFGSGGSGDAEKAIREIQNVPLPVLKEYFPEEYKKIVEMNPELDSAITLGPSAMEGITTDPMAKQAQMRALQSLMGITENDGMTATDRGMLNQINNESNANLKGNTDAIIQNLATRGMSGGPMEAVMRQNAAQSASNRASQQAFDVQKQAQERALQALMGQASLGSNMQSNEFNQKAQVAGSQDAISKFNAQNRQQVQSNNVQTKNSAQQFNVQNAQNTADKNTVTKNSGQQYNLGLAQQNFDNQMGKAGAIANGYNNQAARKDDDRDREAALWGNIISAGASAYGAK